VVAKLDMVFAAARIRVQIKKYRTGSCGSKKSAAAFVFKGLLIINPSKPFFIFKG